jgi:hypothetical protein
MESSTAGWHRTTLQEKADLVEITNENGRADSN